MLNTVYIEGHIVIRGFSISDYLNFVQKVTGSVPTNVTTYEQLVDFLDDYCESNGGWDPLWDFPLYELAERLDTEYYYVELFDGEEPRYFETLIELDSDDKEKLQIAENPRVINLYDCETNYLVKTNAPEKEIQNALDYKNKMLDEDDPSFRSDFEEMQEYLHSRGYIFESIGYVNEIEGYSW